LRLWLENERKGDLRMHEDQAVVAQPVEVKAPTTEAKPGPAQEIRDIQMLLVSGIFPGNMAPAVVKGYQHLDRMAAKIEADARHEEEVREKLKSA